MKYLMKLSVLLIAAFMVVLCLFASPTKANAATSGYYTYTVSGGKATITDVKTSISGNITIPSTLGGYPVTSIGNSAFEDCTGLTSITIPDSVTSIGAWAFCGCSRLTSITIPEGVTSIRYQAFYECTKLTRVTIPNTVTSIASQAFYKCTSLTSANIPDSVTSIGDHAFSGCTSLASVTIPDSVTSIGFWAFANCESLTSVTIPDGVTSISEGMFSKCTSLANVTIPDSVTSIDQHAFQCAGLTNVTIPDSVTRISYGAFSHCTSLASVTIPNSITSIGDSAFYCTSLTNVTIPNSVTNIGEAVFAYCDNLTSVTIPDSVTSIEASAFSHCSSLAHITLPDSVTNIGEAVFAYCTSLTSVTIPDSVTSIGEDAFGWCTSLTSVMLSDSVTSIGDSMFYKCTSLTSVNIPDSVTSVGDYAFCFCDSLTSVIYCGTEDQWYQIAIGLDNENLTSATRSYHNWNEIRCGCDKTCTICGEVNGQWPHTFDNGICTNCGSWESFIWILTKDAAVDIMLTEDLYIDLNGHDLSGAIALNGFKVYGMDSTTNTYTCDSVGFFSCVDENGNAIVPETHFKSDITGETKRYMTINTDNGYTFHRFYLAITHVSLAPAVTGFGYKAEFYGDEMVQAQVNSVGYNLWLDGGGTVTRSMAGFRDSLTLRLKSFDVDNYGEVAVNASVSIVLTDGTVIESSCVAKTLRNMLETINENCDQYNETQLTAVKTMIEKYEIMSTWDVVNILAPTDVLIISDVQTLANTTINKDVYITSTGVATFNNVTVNGNIYCYGQLTCSNVAVENVYAYQYGTSFSCDAYDGVHGKVFGGITCDTLYIMDDALDYAFDKWGKQ